MKQKFAQFISVIGHPLLTIPLFVLIVTFSKENSSTAILVSFLIIGCFFIPVTIMLFVKSRNGSYSNFDVSNRIQRKSLYVFSIPLLTAVTIVLYLTDQSLSICLSVFFALILLIVSMVVNFFVKSSLHVSLNVFLAALVYGVDSKIAVAILLFTLVLIWSRITLGRHTCKEVILGFILGFSLGLIMLHFQGYIF
ncbi:MAG: phosphoesterase PA-phosphatase related protein [Bacteroidetes bacterium]|nr:phosphoesterase PA-phosphatase related protein [Bacteroidota bacterium]